MKEVSASFATATCPVLAFGIIKVTQKKCKINFLMFISGNVSYYNSKPLDIIIS